jgi:hypothetical protein
VDGELEELDADESYPPGPDRGAYREVGRRHPTALAGAPLLRRNVASRPLRRMSIIQPMAMSERSRRKAIQAVERLVEPGAVVAAYAPGRTGPEPVRSVVGLLAGAIGVSVVIAVLTGVILIPGVLLLLVAYYVINGPRGIALANGGVVLVGRSLWTDRPNKVLTHVPYQAIASVTEDTGSRVRLNLGVEQIWVLRKEYERILMAAGLPVPSAAILHS